MQVQKYKQEVVIMKVKINISERYFDNQFTKKTRRNSIVNIFYVRFDFIRDRKTVMYIKDTWTMNT